MSVLHLESNNLVGELPVEWAEDIAWPQLRELGLSNNNLTGTIPEIWVKACSTVSHFIPWCHLVIQSTIDKLEAL